MKDESRLFHPSSFLTVGEGLPVYLATAERRLFLLLGIVFGALLTGCGTAAQPTPTAIASPTPPPPANTPTPPARPTFTPIATHTPGPTATKGPDYPMLVLRWTGGAHIADVDDVSDIAISLMDHPGIIGAYGDEIQITITYDPTKTNPAAIQKILLDLGYKTAPP